MWLQRGAQTVLVPEHMPETLARCLREGWAIVPDPRQVAQPESAVTPEPVITPAEPEPEPEPEHQQPRVNGRFVGKGRR